MQHWLKAIGHAKGPLPQQWRPERDRILARTGFPRRPRIEAGDLLVYYASVWQAVFALIEVTDEPELTDPDGRWPWSVAVQPIAFIEDLHDAPPVEAIGVMPRSMSQHSHIRLGPDHYERAVQAISTAPRSRTP